MPDEYEPQSAGQPEPPGPEDWEMNPGDELVILHAGMGWL